MIRALLVMISATVLCSCMQTNNSSALDADMYGSGSSAVKSIFNQHCTPCHSFQSMSTDALVASGDVVKGDPLNSKLYYRLTGSSGTNGPKNMPQGGSLSTTDVAAIEAWITGL